MKPDRSDSPFLAALLLALLASACSKDDSPPPPPQPIESQAEPLPFVPPENGLLTEIQVSRFLEAHQAMAKVNDIYLDSLEGATPEGRRSAQQALTIARDKVTRKFGLNGYAEYRWILEDAPRNPENVRILEKLRVTTVNGSAK